MKGKLLVGFVNQFYTEKLNLGIYELNSKKFYWIYNDEIKRSLGHVFGVNGIIKFKDKFIVGYQSKPTKIGIYNSEFKLLKVLLLDNIIDLHSFTIMNDKLYCVSTGTNQVIEITLTNDFDISDTKPFYSYGNNNKKDIYHLNSISAYNDCLYITMFGKKNNNSWKNSENGQLIKISDKKIVKNSLQHPHTVYSIDTSLSYCESKTGKFYLGETEFDLLNYTRGICFSNDFIFVGSSGKRIKSRSEGTINTNEASNPEETKSYISIINRSSKKIESKIFLNDFGTEIYELLYLDNGFKIPEWIKINSWKDLSITHLREKIMKQQEFIANYSIKKRIYNLFKLNS